MREETITVTRDELKRLRILAKVQEGSLTMREAAAVVGVTVRQLRRLRRRVEAEGDKGVMHRSRGRRPAHAIPEATRVRIVDLYQGTYRGANASHFSELLLEHEAVFISPSTALRILKEANALPKVLKRRPKRHPPRLRRPKEGMLWQLDASPFAWLDDHCPQFALQAAIDDATGTVVAGVFRPTECLEGYLAVMIKAVSRYGLPEAVYTDRHTIFQSVRTHLSIEQELAGDAPNLSQFGRALSGLGIAHLKATTPQAKGRIERLWQTLQDRLVTEMRIRNIVTIDQANAILDRLIARHNKRFAARASTDEPAYRKAPPAAVLARTLAFSEPRSLSPAGTVSFEGRIYAISAPSLSLPKRSTRVLVIRTLGGDLFVSLQNACFPLRPTTLEPKQALAPKVPRSPHMPPVPGKDSPWRKAMRHDFLRHQAELANPDRKSDAVMAAYIATKPLSRPR